MKHSDTNQKHTIEDGHKLQKYSRDKSKKDQDNSLEILSFLVGDEKPSRQLKENILATITQSKSEYFSGFTTRLSHFFQLPLAKIKPILNKINDITYPQWEKTFIQGVRLQHLSGGERFVDADCGLVYIKAGVSVASHQHLGDEWMLMLQGYMTTNEGQKIAPGDIVLSKSGSSHSLLVDPDYDCIFAVILFNGVKFLE